MSDTAAAQSAQAPASTQQPSIPEWDQNAAVAAAASAAKTEPDGYATGGGHALVAKQSIRNRFDALLPPHRTYLGLRRRWFLVAVLGVFLAIIALVIGLAVGLTQHNGGGSSGGGGKNLPLPSNKQQFTGDLTYYDTGLGSCGITSSDKDNIVAVSHIIFDAASTGSNPNANPLCGLMIRAKRYDEEVGADRSVDLKVVDRCVGCKSTDLDVSPGAFEQMAPIASGRVDVTWAWLDTAPTAAVAASG
ncbi:hypothetical protein AAFC00_004525 [Neodothiora populina]|uniref:RlpA-like protein double-psi beta-barrel domain-containing protein n=1 Tax=Neodothiora populina TaxID=2781224 RepID=A0ABR3P2L1_9PEZI